MGKNILIFADGTGLAGGLLPDEMRSNIYKLYRATRCGPDSTIHPSKQLAFYDPGLGSQTDGGRIKFGWAWWLRNLVAQGERALASRTPLSTATPRSPAYGGRMTGYTCSGSAAVRTRSAALAAYLRCVAFPGPRRTVRTCDTIRTRCAPSPRKP